MNRSLIKYAYILYFFLFSMIINGNVMLDKNDKLSMPLPLPYDGVIWLEQLRGQGSSKVFQQARDKDSQSVPFND